MRTLSDFSNFESGIGVMEVSALPILIILVTYLNFLRNLNLTLYNVCTVIRVGNSLFGFSRESLVFCEQKRERAIRSWKRAYRVCSSFIKRDGSVMLMVDLL